jgi:hypothetical protein
MTWEIGLESDRVGGLAPLISSQVARSRRERTPKSHERIAQV